MTRQVSSRRQRDWLPYFSSCKSHPTEIAMMRPSDLVAYPTSTQNFVGLVPVHYAFQPDIMHRGFNRPFDAILGGLICNSCYLEGTFDPLSFPIGRRLKVAAGWYPARKRFSRIPTGDDIHCARKGCCRARGWWFNFDREPAEGSGHTEGCHKVKGNLCWSEIIGWLRGWLLRSATSSRCINPLFRAHPVTSSPGSTACYYTLSPLYSKRDPRLMSRKAIFSRL